MWKEGKEKMRNHIPSIWRYTLVLDSRVKAKSVKDSKQHKLLFSCESTMTEMFNKVRTKCWFLHQKKVTFIFDTPNYGDKRSYDKLGLNLPAQMLPVQGKGSMKACWRGPWHRLPGRSRQSWGVLETTHVPSPPQTDSPQKSNFTDNTIQYELSVTAYRCYRMAGLY